MAAAVAAHYGDVIDGFVTDHADVAMADELRATGLRVHVTGTVMKNLADRETLAREVLGLAAKIGDGGG